MITGLHHIAIIASDLAKTILFYNAGLGFSVVSKKERPERDDTIVIMRGYGLTLEILVSSNRPKRLSEPEAYDLRHIALRVHQLEPLLERLTILEYTYEPIRVNEFGRRSTFIKDPDGLPIELHE